MFLWKHWDQKMLRHLQRNTLSYLNKPALLLTIKKKSRPLLSSLVHFKKREEGATAVEFGIVALPFCALLFAIIETAMVFFSNQVLETAVADASRLIFTGQAQAGGFDGARFKDEICNRVPALFDCNSMVRIDVKTFTSFGGASVPPPVTDGKLDSGGFGFQPGKAGDIVVVRAAMEYPVYVSILNPNMANLSGNKRLVMATATFRNEPFGN